MFGGFSSWIESASEALHEISQQGADLVRSTGLLELDERYNDTEPTGAAPGPTSSTAPVAAAEPTPRGTTSLTVTRVTEPPSTWTSSVGEWTYLVTAALSDANMCALDPAQLAEPEREALVTTLEALVSGEEPPRAGDAARLPPLDSVYEPSADMLDWLQRQPELMEAYSAAVPEFASEERFWNIFGWKLDVFRACGQADTLLGVCKVCATPAAATADHDSKPLPAKEEAPLVAHRTEGTEEEEEEGEGEQEEEEEGTKEAPNTAAQEAEYWAHVEERWEQLRAREQNAAGHISTVTAELLASDGNLKLLTNLVSKKDVSSALAQSVIESCEYHKVKLTRLLASVIDQQDELSGSSLDMHTGDLYPRLMNANHDLKLALSHVEAVRRGESVAELVAPAAAPVSASSTPSKADAQPAPPSAASELSSPPPPLSQSEPAAGTMETTVPAVPDAEVPASELLNNAEGEATSGALDDTSFEVVLPWDEGE